MEKNYRNENYNEIYKYLISLANLIFIFYLLMQFMTEFQ